MSVTKVTAAAIVAAATLGLSLASAAVDPHAGHGATVATKPAAPAPATPATAKAATPTSKTPVAAVDPAKGRELFASWSCGTCHALADAGGTGHVGPALDGNPALSRTLVVDRVTNGQGAMPGFGGQMTDEEIATVADYIVQFAAK